MANQVLLELESAAQIMLVRNSFVIAQLRLRYVLVGINFDSRSPHLPVETVTISQTRSNGVLKLVCTVKLIVYISTEENNLALSCE